MKNLLIGRRSAHAMVIAFVLLGSRVADADVLDSNGSLGALNIPAGTTVSINTSAMTLTWTGTTYQGSAASITGGTAAAFNFTNITIGSGVTFSVTGSDPIAIIGTGNAVISSGINISAVGSNGVAGGGFGGSGGQPTIGGGAGTPGNGGPEQSFGGQGSSNSGGAGGSGFNGQSGFEGSGLQGPGGTSFGSGGSGGSGGGGSGSPGSTGGFQSNGFPGGTGGNGASGFSGQGGGNGSSSTNAVSGGFSGLVGGSGGGGGRAGGDGGSGQGGGGGGGGGEVFFNQQGVGTIFAAGGSGGNGGAGGAGGNGGSGGNGGAGGGAIYLEVNGRMSLSSGVSFSSNGGNGAAGATGGSGLGGSSGQAGQPGSGTFDGSFFFHGGTGGTGGNGGNGANGGTGGSGGAGSGGTIYLAASLLNGVNADSFSAAGGSAPAGGVGVVGRILFAANNSFTSPTLPNGEISGVFTGPRTTNSFLTSTAATPYLPDTANGPAALGIVTESAGYQGQSQIDALEATLPASKFPLGFGSIASSFTGYDELFVSNLTSASIPNVGLTISGVGTSSIGTLAAGQSWTTLVPTGETQGTVTLSANLGQTLHTSSLGSNFIVGSLAGAGHAAPSLGVVSGNSQTVIIGATGVTAGLSLTNGTPGQTYLASLDVNSLGSGVSGSVGAALVASGSSQSYTASLSTSTLGSQVQTFSLNVGDDHTLSGATAPANTSTGVSLSVQDHSNASLSPSTNQTTETINFGNLLQGANVASQSFTIYNLAANTSIANTANLKLTGFGATGDTALSTNLANFNALSAGTSQSYTATLNTSSNSTTGSKTITISASQLADDSALLGAGNNNNGGITITLQGTVGSATADNSGTGSFNGNALTAAILSSGNYAGLSATAASNLLTTGAGGAGVEHSVAQILLGHNSGQFTGGTATVGMTFRNRMLDETPSNDSVNPGFPNGTPTSPPLAGLPLISDVARLFGMNSAATATSTTTVQTDPFVFEMSFNPATLLAEGATPADLATRGNVYVASLIGDTLAPGDTWENTIDGDFPIGTSTTSVIVEGVAVNVGSAVAGNDFAKPYIGTFNKWEHENPGFHTDGSNIANYLSVWGVDPNGDEAWAIINHNSDFAVVPEPSTFVLFAAGAISLLGLRRRRQQLAKN